MSTTRTDELLASLSREGARLLPPGARVIDCHTHLGADEDGQKLDADTLLAYLDAVAPDAQACTFPLHDPERNPAYRRPNDRVLAWAAGSGGRLIPFCRLDPADDPVAEAERCLGLGARGIKLHPRAQSFGFGSAAMDAIFAVARDADVPILVHAGRGMPPMDDLAELALRYPEVPLILAHAGVAGQGMFASRLAGHPATLYDTSCFSPFDVIELYARVPAERIVFASDAPYGRPMSGLFMALRVAALAGLDDDDRRLLVGGTMRALLDRTPLALPTPPRLAASRPLNGRLLRLGAYLMMSFGAVVGTGAGPDPVRALPGIALARCVMRDPDPGEAGPTLERIDALLGEAERIAEDGASDPRAALGLLHAACVIAATEPI
jgi:predicted TIM-barrel fold metal-dependent hydrolase